MVANNWDRCPRCLARREKAMKAAEARISESYGKVPIEEFDKMRRDLNEDRNRFSSSGQKTLREDYEVTGVSEGQVNFAYTASCKVCGLRVKFDDSHIIPGL